MARLDGRTAAARALGGAIGAVTMAVALLAHGDAGTGRPLERAPLTMPVAMGVAWEPPPTAVLLAGASTTVPREDVVGAAVPVDPGPLTTAVALVAPPPASTTTTTAAPAATSTTSTTTAPRKAAPKTGEWHPARVNPDGSPVRYDPCTTIRYVTRLTGGPSFARSELEWAISQIEGASGLDLVWAGDVSAPYSSSWPADGPLHLGFATESEFWMPDGVSGYGDSATVDTGGGYRRYVGGRVVLRPDHGWTQGTTSLNPLGLMFLHELGHLVGLAHVSSHDEVMTDAGNGTARSLGSGDRAGLAAVGRPAGCLS